MLLKKKKIHCKEMIQLFLTNEISPSWKSFFSSISVASIITAIIFFAAGWFTHESYSKGDIAAFLDRIHKAELASQDWQNKYNVANNRPPVTVKGDIQYVQTDKLVYVPAPLGADGKPLYQMNMISGMTKFDVAVNGKLAGTIVKADNENAMFDKNAIEIKRSGDVTFKLDVPVTDYTKKNFINIGGMYDFKEGQLQPYGSYLHVSNPKGKISFTQQIGATLSGPQHVTGGVGLAW